jgi:hypothetical protein
MFLSQDNEQGWQSWSMLLDVLAEETLRQWLHLVTLLTISHNPLSDTSTCLVLYQTTIDPACTWSARVDFPVDMVVLCTCPLLC